MDCELLCLKRKKQVLISLILIILVIFLYCILYINIYNISKQNYSGRIDSNYKSKNMWGFNTTCESTNSSVSLTAKEQPLNIFYFAVTHHLNREKFLASHMTWARTVPKVHWYSDKPDPEVNVTVISYPEGNSYSVIPFRTLMIFHHVLEHHRHIQHKYINSSFYSGYDWYVRLWDDNYLFNDRLERLLKTQNPDESVLIGKVLNYALTVTDKGKQLEKPFIYPGGGSGWVLSRAAFKTWATNHNNNQHTHKACSLDGLKQYTKYVIANYSTAEDLMLAQCLLAQGVSFIHAFGFQNWYITHSELQMTLQDVVDGKMTALEQSGREEESLFWCGLVKCINTPNCHGVITLHYVKPADMYTLYRMEQDINNIISVDGIKQRSYKPK